MVDETGGGGLGLVRPGLDRADIVDLLEKEMDATHQGVMVCQRRGTKHP